LRQVHLFRYRDVARIIRVVEPVPDIGFPTFVEDAISLFRAAAALRADLANFMKKVPVWEIVPEGEIIAVLFGFFELVWNSLADAPAALNSMVLDLVFPKPAEISPEESEPLPVEEA